MTVAVCVRDGEVLRPLAEKYSIEMCILSPSRASQSPQTAIGTLCGN